jgi:hypothetical protein
LNAVLTALAGPLSTEPTCLTNSITASLSSDLCSKSNNVYNSLSKFSKDLYDVVPLDLNALTLVYIPLLIFYIIILLSFIVYLSNSSVDFDTYSMVLYCSFGSYYLIGVGLLSSSDCPA